MKGSWVTLRDGDERDLARPAILRFASRHAAALAGGSDRSIRETLGQLADYAVATGRRPGRCTDPAAVVEESRRWHARLARAEELAELERIAGLDAGTLTSGGDLALPPAPLAAWTRGSATVRPLVTARELIDEGERMGHCLASYLPHVLAGHCHIYAALVDGAPLTIEVEAGPRSFQVGQIAGRANREPTPDEWAALAPWIETAKYAAAGYQR
ncbi:MAG: hypothetical protein EXR73_13830 [Myxococcales bacterium]|nr:hypothetical protein [Myxococcales bacterium]